ncbi:MAG: T9SS type A sorting domain-containing protein [Bacteroidota bacterium]|nr:T9SS type A sorting domain-containing protein [Bacteroidota bacterium]
MKKIFLLLAVCMAMAVPLKAQWLLNGFETAAKDSMISFDQYPSVPVTLSDTVIAGGSKQGAAALDFKWSVKPNQSWGGYSAIRFYRPRTKDNTYYANNTRKLYRDSSYFNFGGAKYLSIWFNNIKPSSAKKQILFRVRLDEGSDPQTNYWNDNSKAEQWFLDSWNVFDTTAGWKQLIIPLVDRGATGTPNDTGFCWTGWNDGGLGIPKHTLDFSKIVRYGFELSSKSQLPNDSIVSGEILFDNMQLLDYKYQPITKFNSFTADTTGLVFQQNDAGKITLSEETADTLISPSALAIDYKVNCAQSWGGYANIGRTLPAATFLPLKGTNTDVLLFVKVKTPLTSSTGTISNKVIARLILKEKSGEEWYTRMDVKLDSVGLGLGWQMVAMPLNGLKGQWTEHDIRPYDGFYVVTDYSGTPHTLDPDSIVSYRIEFSAYVYTGDPYNAGLNYTGKILVSTLMPSGLRIDPRLADLTPPALVTGLSAITATPYMNSILWNDVPNEKGSIYNVYFSEKAFTKTTDAGVAQLPPFNIKFGAQATTHLLISPVTDQNVTYYYGITAKDSMGNLNQPAIAGPFTNKAKGVPVISWGAPPSFAADGNLNEWAGIQPIRLNSFGPNPTAHVVSGGVLTDSLDLSAKAYLAMDANNLYVAFDVVDDTVSIDTAGVNTWAQDSPDLNIGLYDSKGLNHAGYGRGATPDHMFRFSLNRLNNDHNGTVVMYPGANYIFKKKSLTPGYIVEAKMPFTLLASLYAGDSLFVPKQGMRIPIDFSINDRDGKTGIYDREAILAYSYLNNNSSYQNMYNWTYTWLGIPQSVQQDEAVARTFQLWQNYPNPFNPTTNIKYSIPQSGMVSLKVFDILGREVMTVLNQFQAAGSYTATLDASKLATGVYVYRLDSGSFSSVKKMMLIK